MHRAREIPYGDWLERGADLLLALAVGALWLGPARAALLPAVPLFALLPRLADRFRLAGLPADARLLVPDPLRPDWPRLCARLMLCPALRPDGAPLDYQLDFDPAHDQVRLRAGGRAAAQPLRVPTRLLLPLPLPVGRAPVPLRIEPAPRGTVRVARVAEHACADSLLLAALLTLVALLLDRRLGALAAVVTGARLLAAAARRGWRSLLWPLGRNQVAPPPTPRFVVSDAIALWAATLGLLGYALPNLAPRVWPRSPEQRPDAAWSRPDKGRISCVFPPYP
jgi:hypothetical protein